MDCPYCGSPLIEGHIQTRGEVIKWLPASKDALYVNPRWQVARDEIKLGKYNLFTGGNVKAFRCEKCKKIIIEY